MTASVASSIVALLVSIALLVYVRVIIRRNESKLSRCYEVHQLRMFVMFNHPELYEDLPSFEQMLIDKKPATIDSYLPEIAKRRDLKRAKA